MEVIHLVCSYIIIIDRLINMWLSVFPHFLPSCCSPDFLSEFQSASPVPQRIHRTRSASVNSDRYSVSEGADSKSTPQLLGTMGKFETIS